MGAIPCVSIFTCTIFGYFFQLKIILINKYFTHLVKQTTKVAERVTTTTGIFDDGEEGVVIFFYIFKKELFGS